MTDHSFGDDATMPEESIKNTCQECGKPTHNPKFCGRSCATWFNNRTSPKRKPEGTCRSCGATVPSQRTVCAACRQRERREREDEEDVGEWRNADGTIVRRPVPRVFVFDASGTSRRRFSLDEPAGPFLEYLIGLCFALPACLQRDDAIRYASLIDSFKRASITVRHWNRPDELIPIVDLPLRSLDRGLADWVEIFFDTKHLPLMLTYALAANFIYEHASGAHFWGKDRQIVEITALVEGADRWKRRLFDSAYFKQEARRR